MNRATCPECERRFKLLKDGTVRMHSDRRGQPEFGNVFPRCRGWGKTPAPAQTTEKPAP